MIRLHDACQDCGQPLDFDAAKLYCDDGRTRCIDCVERKDAARRNERNVVVVLALGGVLCLLVAAAIFVASVTP